MSKKYSFYFPVSERRVLFWLRKITATIVVIAGNNKSVPCNLFGLIKKKPIRVVTFIYLSSSSSQVRLTLKYVFLNDFIKMGDTEKVTKIKKVFKQRHNAICTFNTQYVYSRGHRYYKRQDTATDKRIQNIHVEIF